MCFLKNEELETVMCTFFNNALTFNVPAHELMGSDCSLSQDKKKVY